MIGYAESQVFPAYALTDMRAATKLIEKLPGKDPQGRWVRCHELARAVAPFLSPLWTITDGYYETCDHSWLRAPTGIVLDLYAVGQLPQVLLVDTNALLHRAAYRPQDRRRDIREDIVQWLRAQL